MLVNKKWVDLQAIRKEAQKLAFFEQNKRSFDTGDLFWKYESAEDIELYKHYRS